MMADNVLRDAGGLRQSPLNRLADDEIEFPKGESRAIGADESVFAFNAGPRTGYNDERDVIFIRGDVFPDKGSVHPRDLMSARAVLAHEYYGHRAKRGTTVAEGAWNDEFRASYQAACRSRGLSDEDRHYLVNDALERARTAGISIMPNRFIRRVLHGR